MSALGASGLQAHVLRLRPGDDLRAALAAAAPAAGFVVCGIGSLDPVALRFAGHAQATRFAGPHEIVSLAGSLACDGVHLHMSVSDGNGRVVGGHVAAGCIVRTTAEVLVAALPGVVFAREHDPASGYAELVVRAAEVSR